MPEGLLSVADIARERGWDRRWAWRWLRRLENRYGARLVLQGRTLYIDRIELARVVALLPRPIDPRVAQELRRLGDRLEVLEGRQNGLANDVRVLRKAVAS